MTTLLAAVAATTFSFGKMELDCGDAGNWRFALTRETAPDGAEIARVTLDAPKPATPPPFTLRFSVPQVGLNYRWSINDGLLGLPPNWGCDQKSEFSRNMPLNVFFDGNDESRLSVAATEVDRAVTFSCGVREESSLIDCRVHYFRTLEAPLSHYETVLRVDTQRLGVSESIARSVRWIEQRGGYTPCPTPEAARDPLYSTWYCFHRSVTDKTVEAELEIAARLGMKTVILDDGWQMDNPHGGYADCGDWEVSLKRFPDMRAHVARAHELGFKYMVWYSVPFVGHRSKNFEKFKGKYLIENDRGMNAAVFDPRFPEVRRFLVDTYVRALREWNIDGFKLDFIDSFRIEGVDPAIKENYAGRDEKCVQLAVNRLMKEIHAALVAIKPDILVEFRQSYVGPGVRQVGNMLRVADCPGDMRRNRFMIANLRQASGETAVHSDMLEWNFAETPEKASLFILNSIFGVVQYSVMLRDAPAGHLDMIRHWIRFSQEHRKTLLGGAFRPRHPEFQYPIIEAESDAERIIAVYDDGRLVDCGDTSKTTLVLNASGRDRLALRLSGARTAIVRDTYGKVVRDNLRLQGGLSEVSCPSGGYIELAN